MDAANSQHHSDCFQRKTVDQAGVNCVRPNTESFVEVSSNKKCLFHALNCILGVSISGFYIHYGQLKREGELECSQSSPFLQPFTEFITSHQSAWQLFFLQTLDWTILGLGWPLTLKLNETKTVRFLNKAVGFILIKKGAAIILGEFVYLPGMTWRQIIIPLFRWSNLGSNFTLKFTVKILLAIWKV